MEFLDSRDELSVQERWTALPEDRDALPDREIDLVLVALDAPGERIRAVRWLRERSQELPIVVVDGAGNPETVLEATEAGADDAVVRDRIDPEALLRSALQARERRRSLRELQQTQARARALFGAIPDPVLVHCEESLRILDANPAATETYGYTREELREMTIADIRPEEDIPELRKILARPVPDDHRIPGVWRHRRKDGTIFPVEISTSRVLLNSGPARVAIVNDVTERQRAEEERRRLEEQLRAAYRLEAVGRLAGGVAHDFNNLLTAINGYAELLLERFRDEPEVREDLHEIRQAGERAATLTRQLLAFSRRQVLQPRVLDLNRVVADMEKMLRRVLGEDIELTLDTDPDLGPVRADPGQLEQVVLNLAVNAREAMPEGGPLEISTRRTELSRPRNLGDVVVPVGFWVRLTVRDEGPGMDGETVEHLFEPFFSTRPQERTGMGLATVYGIVKQSEGFISVDSSPGEGTAFHIFLPEWTEPSDEPEGEGGASSGEGRETVLVAEDDEVVRKLVVEVLETRGYRVLVAENGEEALKLAREHSGTLDLLVTDVVMPDLRGPEVDARLRETREDPLPVLFISGYTDGPVGGELSLGKGRDFLQKPFTPSSLANKVRTLLGGIAEDRGSSSRE